MRSELNEIILIEQWLLHLLSEDEARNFEAKLLSDEAFAEKVEAQQCCYRFIRQYARSQERMKLETIYRRLLQETGFSNQLNNIFT